MPSARLAQKENEPERVFFSTTLKRGDGGNWVVCSLLILQLSPLSWGGRCACIQLGGVMSVQKKESERWENHSYSAWEGKFGSTLPVQTFLYYKPKLDCGQRRYCCRPFLFLKSSSNQRNGFIFCWFSAMRSTVVIAILSQTVFSRRWALHNLPNWLSSAQISFSSFMASQMAKAGREAGTWMLCKSRLKTGPCRCKVNHRRL